MECDLNRKGGGAERTETKLTSHTSLSRTFSLVHTITLSHTHALTRACKHTHTTPLSLTSARGSLNTKSPIPTLCSRKSEQLADTAQRQSYALQHTNTLKRTHARSNTLILLHTRTHTRTSTCTSTYTCTRTYTIKYTLSLSDEHNHACGVLRETSTLNQAILDLPLRQRRDLSPSP